jgi:hypothetical protein
MKNGLLLTLKQLIKLGVINIKKKRRRRRLSTTKKSPFQQGVNPIDIQGMGQQRYKEFLSASSASNPQAYSDALRLRDESNNFNTRLLEYKNQQQDQKLLLEDQQQQQQQLQQRQLQIQNVITQGIPIINSLTTRLRSSGTSRGGDVNSQGFVVDDNVDVTETIGSDDFKTQQDIADPELRELPPPPPPQLPTTLKEMEQMYKNISKSNYEPYGLSSEYEDDPGKEMQPIQLKPKRGRGRPKKINR